MSTIQPIPSDSRSPVKIIGIEDGNTILTDIRFDHPHIVEISAGKIKMDENSFNSAHSVINNLGYEFTFEIIGNIKGAFAESVIIHLGDEHLASIKLISINH